MVAGSAQLLEYFLRFLEFPVAGVLVPVRTDSRGFAYTQSGPIGGDLGGIYNILFDGSAFTLNGHSVRIKQTVRTMSPFNYKVATSVSVDGGPFRNYGNPWWKKEPK